jgi:hypothetical protein
MDMEFDATEIFAFASRADGATEAIGQEMTKGIDRVTIQGVAAAQPHIGVKTGTLRRSMAHKPATFGGGVATGSYGTAVPYARIHNDGRGPVVAGPGKMLRFEIGGQTLYRKRVGPAAGRQFMEKSVARIRPMLPREMNAVLKRIVARMGG